MPMFRLLVLISTSILFAGVSVHALPATLDQYGLCSDASQVNGTTCPFIPDLFDEADESGKSGQVNDPNTRLTYYWIKYQTSADQGKVQLRSCNGKILFGTASSKFAKQIRMEGSGHLLNGKMLNLGDCNCGDGANTFHCFDDITKDKIAPFGYGVEEIPLIPFVSVANNDDYRPVGIWLYARDFDGIRLPNGRKHNGCMQKVDVIGRGGTPNHIDFFAMTEASYEMFDSIINKDYIDVVWNSTKCSPSKLKGYRIKP